MSEELEIWHDQPITVAQLIAELQRFPPDALVFAYEGEDTGIVVQTADNNTNLGFIEARES